jgi:hypothetical protein
MKTIIFIFVLLHVLNILTCADSYPRCGLNPPTTTRDCFNRNIINNSTSSYCCYLWDDYDEKICALVDKDQYGGLFSNITYGDKLYHIYCDLGVYPGQAGTQCGSLSPKTVSDCHDDSGSEYDNICCLYSYKGKNLCFWMGYNFSHQPINYDNTTINCKGEMIFYTISHYLLFIILLTLI